MTKILILGGGGMIGQKLAQRILSQNTFANADVTLFDRAFPDAECLPKEVTGDVSDPATARTFAASAS